MCERVNRDHFEPLQDHGAFSMTLKRYSLSFLKVLKLTNIRHFRELVVARCRLCPKHDSLNQFNLDAVFTMLALLSVVKHTCLPSSSPQDSSTLSMASDKFSPVILWHKHCLKTPRFHFPLIYVVNGVRLIRLHGFN